MKNLDAAPDDLELDPLVVAHIDQNFELEKLLKINGNSAAGKAMERLLRPMGPLN